jgi:hypothetical protein
MSLKDISTNFLRVVGLTKPTPVVSGPFTQSDWRAIVGKTVKSIGLSKTGVAITFTDDTFVAAEFRNGDCYTSPTLNPASCYLNRALIAAGVVTQEQVEATRTVIEAKQRQIAQLQHEIDDQR